MKILILALILSSLTPFSWGQHDEQQLPPRDSGIWGEIKRLYERAKAAGENVPADAYQWARQQFDSIGDWEYRVVEVETTDSPALQEKLNELGKDRWEVIWIRSAQRKTQFILKRPVLTYLDRANLF